MPSHLKVASGMPGDIIAAVRQAIESAIPGARVHVEGGGGHFTIDAVSSAFDGKSRIEQQRMILSAIKHLMAGPNAPVHAVDRVSTRPS
jgi:acid stress-induced BolA-like protein IbaG/YrbA